MKKFKIKIVILTTLLLSAMNIVFAHDSDTISCKLENNLEKRVKILEGRILQIDKDYKKISDSFTKFAFSIEDPRKAQLLNKLKELEAQKLALQKEYRKYLIELDKIKHVACELKPMQKKIINPRLKSGLEDLNTKTKEYERYIKKDVKEFVKNL